MPAAIVRFHRKRLSKPVCWLVTLSLLFGASTCTRSDAPTPQADLNARPTVGQATPLPKTATASPVPEPSETPPASLAPDSLAHFQVCSPFSGIELDELPEWISNPFHPPSPGSDDPHQGVDLADILGDTRVAVPGREVRSVLAGRVAGLIKNRFPYGNALILETPLDELPINWQEDVQIPTLAPTPIPRSALTCPDLPVGEGQIEDRSLYVLYGHLLSEPSQALDERIECGQPLGQIGQSGNALSPHVHIEVRAGPGGMRFNSMAHYDASASDEEMAAYCRWRVSGALQLVDPMRLLLAAP